MGVRVISSNMGSVAVMYCSTTDWAFGPVFYDDNEHSADERVQMFINWLESDPRGLPDNVLESKYQEWRTKEAELWRAYEEEQQKLYLEDSEPDGVQ